jgi:hypothetical protein
MVRIIYHISGLGYRIQDRYTHEEILRLKPSLENANAAIVCIVDFKNKIVSNKCLDFQVHMDRINHHLFDRDYVQL